MDQILERKLSQLLKWAKERGFELSYEDCYMCHGSGEVVRISYGNHYDIEQCSTCSGNGTIPELRDFEKE